MQRTKLTAFLAVLALGAAASAGAQTVVIEATPDTPPPTSGDVLVVVPPTATPVPDPAADAKCRAVAPIDYWDCVNSHNGGQ
ncbi:MAG TPA: hypothetical protein VLQ46_10735 [Casimicrobiaceae bacterium]|nr:hypothetical protein [Casimicrobiaceae bacterium]